VTERVPEVQEHAQPRLPLVLRHHAGLDRAVALEDRQQPLELAAEQPLALALERLEQPRIADRRVLHHLRQPGAALAQWECRERCGVDPDQTRLMKGADQVLAPRHVDAGLPAHAGVHHRQQRGGYLHHRQAAQQRRRHEAGEVAHHPASERDDHRAPVRTGPEQRIVEAARLREALAALPVRDVEATRA
jgi:hypothetical protein